jgi:hypothetical protein
VSIPRLDPSGTRYRVLSNLWIDDVEAVVARPRQDGCCGVDHRNATLVVDHDLGDDGSVEPDLDAPRPGDRDQPFPVDTGHLDLLDLLVGIAIGDLGRRGVAVFLDADDLGSGDRDLARAVVGHRLADEVFGGPGRQADRRREFAVGKSLEERREAGLGVGAVGLVGSGTGGARGKYHRGEQADDQ